jgi:hypothetical protein
MTTVLLVRNVQPGRAAAERALALAHTAFKAGVTAVYASPPQDVVLRLADVRGLKVQNFGPDDVEGFVSRLLSEHAGEVVVVVGAPDTIADIIRKLSGGLVPSVAPDEYDDLFLVTVYEPGAAKVLDLQYGPAH